MNFRRWTFARRISQLAVLLFLVSPLAGMTVFNGSLAAADIGRIPLVDPLAAIQAIIAAHVWQTTLVVPAVAVTLWYFFIGGRTFCSWICPVYLLGEICDRLRRFLGTGEVVMPLATKLWVLFPVLLITAITGLPLFEIISPIGMVSRAVAYGSYIGVSCLAGLLLVEVVFARRLWCRSLCPLGGFYSIVGRMSPVRIAFARSRCTDCGECQRICPVEEVLVPVLDRSSGFVRSGDCTRCGACIDVCPHVALGMIRIQQ